MGVAALPMIAIHERLSTQFDDKLYPVLLVASIILWHRLAWLIFFDVLKVPAAKRAEAKNSAGSKRRLHPLTSLGYLFLAMTVFNFYMSPEYAHAARGVRYSLCAIGLGLLLQMVVVVRRLIAVTAR